MNKTKLPSGWKIANLNTVLTERKQRNRDSRFTKDDVLSVSGDVGIVNQIEFMGRSYAGVSVREYHIVEPNDIVYTKSPLKNAPYGIIKANFGTAGIVSTLYAVYKCENAITAKYLDYYFSVNTYLNNYLRPLVRKGAKNDMKVNNEMVLRGTIPLPPLPEQRAIADILTDADRLIAAKVRKIEAVRKRKRGIMQNLMTGKKRVRGFSGKWERAKLGERITLQRGYDLPKDNMCNGKYRVVGSNGIIGYHDKYTTEAPSITVGRSGSVGKVLILNERTWSHNTALYVKNSTNIDNYYLYYLLSFLKLDNYAGKSAVPTLNRNDVHSIEINFPTITEQKAIAKILTTADRELELLEKDLDRHKQIKKYLMQKLLTGKIRVGAGGKK